VNSASRLLFTPGRIGRVEIRNRVVMPAMTTRLADEEGFVTEATIAWFAARARGGAGLITVEMASPEKAGRHHGRELGIYDDRFLPGLKRLVARLHEAGARFDSARPWRRPCAGRIRRRDADRTVGGPLSGVREH
jgi:2,4-dienoyl-CoA reductase-like NADH-dependent reductase (Old Yellow Enzyme family)